MKIAIYGGSFNPPHIGHELAATVILATEDVDELWFTPTYQHMMGKELLDFNHRLNMTRLISRRFGNRASVSRAEERLSKKPGFIGSESINLIRDITDEWKDDEFRFVIGSDLLEHFDTWDGAEEIKQRAPLLIVPRAGYARLSTTVRQIVIPDVSSSYVRKAIQRGEDVRKLVPRDVFNYISAHHLYGTNMVANKKGRP